MPYNTSDETLQTERTDDSKDVLLKTVYEGGLQDKLLVMS